MGPRNRERGSRWWGGSGEDKAPDSAGKRRDNANNLKVGLREGKREKGIKGGKGAWSKNDLIMFNIK